ncbi:MAG: hypothetical protein J6Y25_07335 [Elusimicrobiaceae bacterium]|nr:hypothetical protein [Elusimicrobiaceae bacterium]
MKKLFLLCMSALAMMLLPLALNAKIPSVQEPLPPIDPGDNSTADVPMVADPYGVQLQNFDLSVDVAVSDEIQVTLTPKGDPGFYLHVQIQPEFSFTWCTGDEALCKVVGSGQSCDDAPESGNWCYEDLEEDQIVPGHGSGNFPPGQGQGGLPGL